MGLIGRIFVRLGLDNSEFKRGLKDTEGESNRFASTMKGIGAKLLAFFAVERLVAFGKELVDLRSKVKGVQTAFDALDRPDLLNELRKATNNSVSDLQLMQKAVQAKNFRLPLDELATYLQFATQRARETGESVDFLVDSIITGLGRKSVMILDNLGISAAEIREEMARGGTMAEAVGRIIKKEMGEANVVLAETQSISDQIATSWANMKAKLSQGGIGTILRGFGLMLKNQMDAISGPQPMGSGLLWEQEAERIKKYIHSVEQAEWELKALRGQNLTQSQKIWKQLLEEYILKDKQAKAEELYRNNSVAGIQEQIDATKSLLLVETDNKKREALLKELESLDKRLKALIGEVEVRKTGLIPTLEEEIKKRKELLDFEKDPEKIRAINDEVALLERKLAIAKMTTSEYKEHQRLQSYRTDMLPTVGGVPTGGVVSATNTSGLDKLIEQQMAKGKAAGEEALKVMEEQQQKAQEIANAFGQTIAMSISDSIGVLVDSLMNVGKLDTSSLINALLTPFADMAVQMGEVMVATGIAAEAAKAIALPGGGIAAIGAGVALIALGKAAQAGLSAAANKSFGGQSNTGTSFNGAGGMDLGSAQRTPIVLEGVLKGEDIYLSNKKAAEKRAR